MHEELNHDTTEADEMNLEIDHKDEVIQSQIIGL